MGQAWEKEKLCLILSSGPACFETKAGALSVLERRSRCATMRAWSLTEAACDRCAADIELQQTCTQLLHWVFVFARLAPEDLAFSPLFLPERGLDV
jgi:hypothetical protein